MGKNKLCYTAWAIQAIKLDEMRFVLKIIKFV
jgi:hypothetical protein